MTGEALHHYRHCGSEASCHWPSLTELRNLVRPHADAYIKSLSFESLALQWLASIPIKIFHKHISYLLYINRCIYTVFIYYSLSSYVCIYIYISHFHSWHGMPLFSSQDSRWWMDQRLGVGLFFETAISIARWPKMKENWAGRECNVFASFSSHFPSDFQSPWRTDSRVLCRHSLACDDTWCPSNVWASPTTGEVMLRLYGEMQLFAKTCQ